MPTRTIGVLQSELVNAVRKAMVEQLRRDGNLVGGEEIALTFYSTTTDDANVVGSVVRNGVEVHRLSGNRNDLCAIATNVALGKFTADERRRMKSPALVHWRSVKFGSGSDAFDTLVVDVEFTEVEA